MSNSLTPEPGSERTLRSGTRNPRRRARQSDGDSVKTAPRRKRSKISENTFIPPRHEEEAEAEAEAEVEVAEMPAIAEIPEVVEEEQINGSVEAPLTNGDTQTPSPRIGRGRLRHKYDEPWPTFDMEIPLRSRRAPIKRPTKGDGATILTQNSRYSIKQLPSTPKDLRREGVEYRGSLGAGNYALAIVRERAYVWDYTSHGPVSNPKVFDMPFSVKTTDVLPFGALVSTGASSDIGLVLLSATSGKIVYYESIERAASLGLFQERNLGVEGSLGSLFSGEVVTDIISADHAGFIVTLSSGRIAQLTLRDAQGRSRVFAQFLRAADPGSGRWFGSIKGFLGAGGWKRDVIAVHTRPLGSRGQVQVISLTERAELQIWDLDWSGQYRFKSTVDFREVITTELKKVELPELHGKVDNLVALDFCILNPPSPTTAIATAGSELPLEILLLLRIGTPDNSDHVLAAINIEGYDVLVPQVSQLSTYHSSSFGRTQGAPRLILPDPKQSAIVAFSDAIVVKQMEDAELNTPEAQLHASYVQPSTFEDTVYIRRDKNFTILGACEEDDKGSQQSAILFVRGAGLIRISVVDPTTVEEEEDGVSVKGKIEQAVFHGALQEGNIIDFSRLGEGTFSPQDVEDAALMISDEVLRSTSPFINANPTSMDAHLAYKSQALRALATYVRQSFPTLSKAATWQLLWDAEKVAAAHQMWLVFEEHLAACSRLKRTATVLDEVCENENRRRVTLFNETEDDASPRNFFIYKLHRMDTLLVMICDLLNILGDEADKTPHTKMRLVMEANDLWNTALEKVFAFRMENASAYGILPEFMEDGVFADVAEYAELPEFWTSTEPMLKAVVHMATVSRELAHSEFEKTEHDPKARASLGPLLDQVRLGNPRLIQSLCLIYQERINWLASRPSEKDRELATKLESNYLATRHDQFRDLASIAQSEAGMKLAEKYKDMGTLTEIIEADLQFAIESMNAKDDNGNPVVHESQVKQAMAELDARASKYFQQFGEAWATAYFDMGFSDSQAGIAFIKAQENWPEPLTTFLRADPSRAKLCWINDITFAHDFEEASKQLVLAAEQRETKLWDKKIELSMGKLTLLAAQEDMKSKHADVARSDTVYSTTHGEMEVVMIQEQVYQYLLPEVRHCIDHQAEVEVAMQKFGNRILDLHALRQLLETYLDRLLGHLVLSADELIDMLTLLDNTSNTNVDYHNVQGQEFLLALKALDAIATKMPSSRFETLLQLIWKRCYVYDDWVEINNRQKFSDEEVLEKLQTTAAWRTLDSALESGFFDSPDTHVRHLLPSACLGAGCRAEDLDYRWGNPDLLDPILHDNRVQDEQLESFVTDRYLDGWVETCVRDVKGRLEEEADVRGLHLAREREFEADVRRDGIEAKAGRGEMMDGMMEVDGTGEAESAVEDDAGSVEML